jgi:hypothetical protein
MFPLFRCFFWHRELPLPARVPAANPARESRWPPARISFHPRPPSIAAPPSHPSTPRHADRSPHPFHRSHGIHQLRRRSGRSPMAAEAVDVPSPRPPRTGRRRLPWCRRSALSSTRHYQVPVCMRALRSPPCCRLLFSASLHLYHPCAALLSRRALPLPLRWTGYRCRPPLRREAALPPPPGMLRGRWRAGDCCGGASSYSLRRRSLDLEQRGRGPLHWRVDQGRRGPQRRLRRRGAWTRRSPQRPFLSLSTVEAFFHSEIR